MCTLIDTTLTLWNLHTIKPRIWLVHGIGVTFQLSLGLKLLVQQTIIIITEVILPLSGRAEMYTPAHRHRLCSVTHDFI